MELKYFIDKEKPGIIRIKGKDAMTGIFAGAMALEVCELLNKNTRADVRVDVGKVATILCRVKCNRICILSEIEKVAKALAEGDILTTEEELDQ